MNDLTAEPSAEDLITAAKRIENLARALDNPNRYIMTDGHANILRRIAKQVREQARRIEYHNP